MLGSGSESELPLQMDPPALINGGAFPAAGAAPYNLAENWPFQLNGVQPAGRRLGLRGPPFGQGNGISPFSNGSIAIHEASGDGPAGLEQRMSLGSGGGRKRPDSEDESAKAGASTSNGDGLVISLFCFLGIFLSFLPKYNHSYQT